MPVINCNSSKLAKPISFTQRDLQKGQVLEFNKTTEDYADSFDPEHDYNIDDFQKFVKLDLLECDDSGSALNKYKQDMVPVPYGSEHIQDGKLMKKIKEAGSGDKPVPGSYVKIHYMYYSELQEVPIDITYLRKNIPEKFQLGKESLMVFMEYAILSMKKGEKSDFFASYELCFGELGCPPRIPPKADLLFEIHLIDFTSELDVKSLSNSKSESLSGNHQLPFEEAMKQAQELGDLGKSAFQRENVVGALRRYREAVHMLNQLQEVSKLEERNRLEAYLSRMYRNLMVCYTRRKDYQSCCQCARDALLHAKQCAAKDMKLFFLWGKAQNCLEEWETAMDTLKTARRLATKTSDLAEIDKELLLAETQSKKHKEELKQLCQKMFTCRIPYKEDEPIRPATIQEIRDPPQEEEIEEEFVNFKELMELTLGEFKMCETAETQSLGEAQDFHPEEIQVLKTLASTMGLVCKVDTEIVLTKPY